ncbi:MULTISPECIES: serine hydrolase domain-containing protein [unclassified Bradyrhizobium]|uniref:serine hydrolase domain-containing protein n=1 Tax=unclassified Bradyrhizobium TaxID=2631580 RepID=UPI002304E6FC|nr:MULTISPECIES: serine hydrolase domain-containing protein [unclassified Bradyrhizobium]MDA9409434.1 penicillin-binding protein [Bradyrhizobium sp. CCBAU 45384]MDA9443412.1 penicillin-binding protein [Bradyrhizobium sp. CCBAU 51745]
MQRRQFMSLLGGAALTPVGATPVFAAAHANCAGPARREDGWSVPSASADNDINLAALCGMADRLESSGANIHAVLVARHGRLAFERYFNGSDEVPSRFFGVRVKDISFDADTLHNLKSCSKSVASLVIGIAIDQGLIRSIDEPVFNFFPELSDLRSPDKDRILLSHLLTMSLGLKWVEATPATGDDNDEVRMHLAQDACRYVLGLPVTAPAGQEFFYNTGALAVLSAIIRKAAGRPLDEFARSVLFDPLGITEFEWRRFKGDSDAGGGLRLRPRDMAKIGQLVLAGGRWNDRQIVSKAWIEASTATKLKANDYQSYGYLWWLGRSRLNGRMVPWMGALGRGGQSIRIVPELDLVVAVTAGYYQDYSPEAFKLQYDVFRDVLQAISPPV